MPQVVLVAPRCAAFSGWSSVVKKAEIAARDGGIFTLLSRPFAGRTTSFSASEGHESYPLFPSMIYMIARRCDRIGFIRPAFYKSLFPGDNHS